MSLLQEMLTHGLADCEFNRQLKQSAKMRYEEWAEKYQPIKNHLDKEAQDDQYTFETYGVEVGFVLGVNFVDPKRVWTLIDGSEGTYIIDGYHLVDRISYFVTQKPYEGMEGSFSMLDHQYANDEDESNA